MIIGLIRERKKPADSRVALTPDQAAGLMKDIPGYRVMVERSPDRSIPDKAYAERDIPLVERATGADVLLGIKEVPVEELIADKSYMFFSHTIKKQPYNRDMFRAMAERNITLIDYECLEWPRGGRILGFGRWAGIVGTYNGILTWGRKYNTFNLKPAHQCADYEELKRMLKQINVPAIKIALTGEGRVSSGALEILQLLGIREVRPDELMQDFDEPVYCWFRNADLYQRNDGGNWDTAHFFENHNRYRCLFDRYLPHVDLLINGLYWEDDMDRLFTKRDTGSPDFNISVIADISCDVEGSVPITMKATTIDDPVIGWDPVNQAVTAPFGENSIDVMAVTNLPAELPVSASEDFGSALSEHVLPLFLDDPDGILEQATILKKGKLTPPFMYLADYLKG